MAIEVERTMLAGGVKPDAGALFQETLNEFMDDPMPYLLAGLGQAVVLFPLIFGVVFGMYFLMFVGVFGSVIGGTVVGIVVTETFGESLGGIAMLATMLGSYGLMILAIVGSFVLIGAVMAPMQASLTRRVAEHQRGGRKLDFMAPFTDMTQDLGKVLTVAFLFGLIMLMGAMACYLPALIAAVLLTYSTTFVALHGMRPVRALMESTSHVADNLDFHGLFALMYFGLSMLAGYIPIAGPMFVMALHVRSYRMVFGDAEEPVLRLSPR
jgi:hypothetical protein